ncbi:ribonuclease h2 subunit b [Zalerion maritima]|uniref:Ribonuclease H2 subunit B n=1 Tax=Zalerion maritima TaxID=339359 RepID=A0AAD5WPM3_9PEZI|nr:ribonuclease h2 subunit b [Zalerion maritima]
MARTRASKATSKEKSEDIEAAATSIALEANKLPPSSTTPPKVFILPETTSPSCRIISLEHPRYGKPTRYLMCPETGIYEFTRITSPKSYPRSWLLEPESRNGSVSISKNPDLYVATRIDPLFLLLPILYTKYAEDSKKRMFLSVEHHLETLGEGSAHMSKVLQSDKIRTLFADAMRQVCDSVEAGDETMYRLNESKLLSCLLGKARRFSEPTLPASMEEKFVISVLVAPMTNALTINGSTEEETKKDGEANGSSGEDSQASASTNQPPTNIVELQRRKVAFNFICSSYVSPEIAKQLSTMLNTKNSEVPVDFSPLEEYLQKLAKLKQEALTARSLIDYTRKRGLEDDDEAAERAEKKRKKDEEEKRKKAGESRGVKNLKKVNVTGMKKLSEFFKKK